MNRRKALIPLVLVFVLLNVFFFAGKTLLDSWQASREVLVVGHALIFLITLVSFLIVQRSLGHANPNVFVRSVMASVMVKMFILAIAAFVYISMFRKTLNKPALFICMGLYLFYTFLEVSALTRMLKQKANG